MNESDHTLTFGEALCLTCLTPLNKCDRTITRCSSVLSEADKITLVKKVMSACSIKLFSDEQWQHLDDCMCPTCVEQLDSLVTFLELCIKSQEMLNKKQWQLNGECVYVKIENSFDDCLSIDDADDIPLSEIMEDLKRKSCVKQIVKCVHCPKTFRSQGALSRHMAKHDACVELSCEYCNSHFATMQDVKEHMRAVHGAGAQSEPVVESLKAYRKVIRRHSCAQCPKTFVKMSVLRDHVANVHSGTKRFVCECGRSYSRRCKLLSHVALVHEQRPPGRSYACERCDKTFRHRQSLHSHVNMHLGVRPFLCSVCAEAFTSQANLKNHMRRMHSEDRSKALKKHLCDTCGEAFNRASHLKRHSLRKHTENVSKVHECPVCHKRFLEKSDVTCHLKLHEDVKPFACPQCPKVFRNPWQLRGHVNRIHLGIRPFECTTCEARFKTMCHLKKHVRTHTGEKPYACPHCAHTCAEKSNLKKHINIHLKNR